MLKLCKSRTKIKKISIAQETTEDKSSLFHHSSVTIFKKSCQMMKLIKTESDEEIMPSRLIPRI